jgi:hypothetical protein
MEADDGIVRVNLPFVVVTPRHELLLLLLKRRGGVLHETVSAVVLVETNLRGRNGVGSHEKNGSISGMVYAVIYSHVDAHVPCKEMYNLY